MVAITDGSCPTPRINQSVDGSLPVSISNLVHRLQTQPPPACASQTATIVGLLTSVRTFSRDRRGIQNKHSRTLLCEGRRGRMGDTRGGRSCCPSTLLPLCHCCSSPAASRGALTQQAYPQSSRLVECQVADIHFWGVSAKARSQKVGVGGAHLSWRHPERREASKSSLPA